MGQQRFVFSIGPLPGRLEAHAVFVAPARPGADFFVAESVREGLLKAIVTCPEDQLVVAPDLAGTAAQVGLGVARFDDAQRDAMIKATYQLAIPELLTTVTDRSLVARFARAGAHFATAAPWSGGNPLRYVAISFDGDITPKEWEAVVAGPPDGAGFSAFPGRGAILRLANSVDQGGVSAVAAVASLALGLDTPPPFIAGAMRTALGIELFPRPIAMENGELKVFGDGELAVISALTESIAALAETGRPKTISVRAAGVEFSAIARPFDPAD